MSKQLKVILVLVTLSVLWGSSFLAIKVVIDAIPPILAFGIRFAASGAILLAVYVFHTNGNTKCEHVGKQQWKDALILVVVIILGGQGLLVWGAQYLSSGVTALLNSTIPLWIADNCSTHIQSAFNKKDGIWTSRRICRFSYSYKSK